MSRAGPARPGDGRRGDWGGQAAPGSPRGPDPREARGRGFGRRGTPPPPVALRGGASCGGGASGGGASRAGWGLVEDWALVRMGSAWAGPWSRGGGVLPGWRALSAGSGGAGRRPRLREPHSGAGLLGKRSFYGLVGGFSGLTIVCRRDFWAEGACVGAELLKRGD